MKLVLAIMLLIPGIEINGNTATIYYDGGGNIAEYEQQIKTAKKNGVTNVVIDGICPSACILWMHESYDLNVCAKENAAVGFHIPYSIAPNGKVIVSEEEYSIGLMIAREMVIGLPEKLRDHWFGIKLPAPSKGDPVSMMDWVIGDDAVDMIGDC